MLSTNVLAGIGMGTGAVGLTTGVGSLIFSAVKLSKLNKKLTGAIKNISDSTEVEIADSIVQEAVNKAVNEQAERQVDAAIKRASYSVETEMRTRIQKEIDAQYSDLRGKVKEEMERKVGSIDVRDIRREVVEEARREAKMKFDESLSEIVKEAEEKFEKERKALMNEYNSKIQYANEIYRSFQAQATGGIR